MQKPDPTKRQIVVCASAQHWRGLCRTLDDIRRLPEISEWDRRPSRPKLA